MNLTKNKLVEFIKEELEGVLSKDRSGNKKDPLVKEAMNKKRYYIMRPDQEDDRTGPGGAPQRKDEDFSAVYTIKTGDSLWEIAKEKLGDSSRWTNLLDKNELLAGDAPVHGFVTDENNQKSPKILAGWKLHIPDAIGDLNETQKRNKRMKLTKSLLIQLIKEELDTLYE